MAPFPAYTSSGPGPRSRWNRRRPCSPPGDEGAGECVACADGVHDRSTGDLRDQRIAAHECPRRAQAVGNDGQRGLAAEQRGGRHPRRVTGAAVGEVVHARPDKVDRVQDSIEAPEVSLGRRVSFR
jgi:hypothetical protein